MLVSFQLATFHVDFTLDHLIIRKPPISSVDLRMDDDVIRVAVGLRLGANLCEPHTCTCGVPVDARGMHGLACKRSTGRHPRHGLLNDVVWRAMLRASRSRPARNRQDSAGQTGSGPERGLADPLVTRPLCDLGRHVPLTPSPHPISRHRQHRQGQRLLEQKRLRP